MALAWTIRGFALRNGKSVIDEWMDSATPQATAKFDQSIASLRDRKLTDWFYNYAHKRVSSGGLWEVKFEANGIAHRPLFYLGPDDEEMTFLIFSEERNNTLKPVGCDGTARDRMNQIEQSPTKAITYDGEREAPK